MGMMDDVPAHVADVLADLSRGGVGLVLVDPSMWRIHGPRTPENEDLIDANRELLKAFLGDTNPCRQKAIARLRQTPNLHRAMHAAQNPDGSWMVGVAVRLDDGGESSAVGTGINLDPFQIVRWCEEETFQERAAVREYDGRLSRPASELMAVLDIIRSSNKLEK